jgi:hypothetical protein
MRGLTATGIVSTALVLVATALYLHSRDAGNDTTSQPARLGAGVTKGPEGAWPRMERTVRVEERPGQAGVAPAEPTKPADAQVDQRTFGALYQAASALALATGGPNVTRAALRDLVESLETEVSLAEARAKTPTEVQMVGLYADAIVAYRDGLQFWDLRRFADRPGESDPLDALAAKYGIQPVKKISYTATWEGYPNAFSKIWAVGNAATAKGSALYSR